MGRTTDDHFVFRFFAFGASSLAFVDERVVAPLVGMSSTAGVSAAEGMSSRRLTNQSFEIVVLLFCNLSRNASFLDVSLSSANKASTLEDNKKISAPSRFEDDCGNAPAEYNILS